MIRQIFIVIPCFNEELHISLTCQSLGFGLGDAISSLPTNLVLVNNNSTDDTEKILQQIKAQSPENTVFIHFEPVKGYVSARHAGNLLALRICETNNWDINDVLIVQADADTVYLPGYVETITKLSNKHGSNVLIEATVGYDQAFREQHTDYIHLCKKIDNEVQHFFPMNWDEDVVIDDKVSSYRLSDYLSWGGHVTEVISGEEIFAETTRLYLRGKLKGATKKFTDLTWALHSSRKIFRNPVFQFVTAGFPRGRQYRRKIETSFNDELNEWSVFRQPTTKMIDLRKLHLLAFFAVLPYHVGKATSDNPESALSNFYSLIEHLLPARTLNDLNHPGIFIDDALLLIDTHEEYIINIYNSFFRQ